MSSARRKAPSYSVSEEGTALLSITFAALLALPTTSLPAGPIIMISHWEKKQELRSCDQIEVSYSKAFTERTSYKLLSSLRPALNPSTGPVKDNLRSAFCQKTCST